MVLVLSPASQVACLPFPVVAKCFGLKVPCRLRSPRVHLAGVMSLLKRLESLGGAAPKFGPRMGIVPCLGLTEKRLWTREMPHTLLLSFSWGCHLVEGKVAEPRWFR